MIKHKKKVICAVVLILIIGLVVYRQRVQAPAKTVSTVRSSKQTAGFDKSQYSVSEPGSLWWIVNKKRPLPTGYVPPNLVVPQVSLRLDSGAEQMHIRQDVATATEQLFAAGKAAGYPLTLASGYRSAAYQAVLYNSYVVNDGQAAADRSSAKPNTSEHQTGMAMDVCALNTNCDLVQSFGKTPTGAWLANNSYKYGFIIRYADGKEASTGYEYEPWHIRYVGVALANELHRTGQSMEEFFGVGSGAL